MSKYFFSKFMIRLTDQAPHCLTSVIETEPVIQRNIALTETWYDRTKRKNNNTNMFTFHTALKKRLGRKVRSVLERRLTDSRLWSLFSWKNLLKDSTNRNNDRSVKECWILLVLKQLISLLLLAFAFPDDLPATTLCDVVIV